LGQGRESQEGQDGEAQQDLYHDVRS
jgi:hypothetical protein